MSLLGTVIKCFLSLKFPMVESYLGNIGGKTATYLTTNLSLFRNNEGFHFKASADLDKRNDLSQDTYVLADNLLMQENDLKSYIETNCVLNVLLSQIKLLTNWSDLCHQFYSIPLRIICIIHF